MTFGEFTPTSVKHLMSGTYF